MESTGRYELPLIMPQQAQKHVTHNEAMLLVDGILHPIISGFGLNEPPANPGPETAWFIGSAPTGDWYDQPGRIALNTAAGWRFLPAKKGMIALDQTLGRLVSFDGSTWISIGNMIEFGNIPTLGINAASDLTNRLSVRSNAALFSAIGAGDGGDGDMQLKINRETPADTGTLLFQTGWAGRAEIGHSGDETFRIKVSPDGAAWNDAISISGTTGIVTVTPGSITNGSLAAAPSGTIKGRAAPDTGQVDDLSGWQVASMLPVFSNAGAGLVPAATANTGLFLRGDGEWAEPLPTPNPKRFFAFNECVTATSSQDWSVAVAGAGSTHSSSAFGEPNAIGALQAILGTTATGRCSISSGTFTSFLPGQGQARFATRLRMGSLSDSTNSFSIRAGFIDSLTGESTDGVFFRYSHASSAGYFQAVCRNNGVESVAVTNVQVSTATTYVLEILIAGDAGTATFTINGVEVAGITTNIPSTGGRELGYGLMALRSAGTVSASAYLVDYLLVDVLFSTPR